MKQRQDPATKPYYKCLSCQRFRKTCGGIPTRDMDLKEWCEYMRDVKDLARITNAYIAKEADVSSKTIEKIMAINTEQDIMRATARRVERVVIGPVGEHFCYQDYKDDTIQEQIKRLTAEIEFWKGENDRKARIIDKLLES